MPRSPVGTRAARPDDLPALLELWHELREVGGRAERVMNPVGVADVGERLAAAMASGQCHVVLASCGGEPAGMVIVFDAGSDPLSDSRTMHIAHLVVAKSKRRRGVGRALLSAVAELAEARQAEHVSVGVYPSLRDASRFYARLGFAAVAVRRMVPVSVLRRRLGTELASARVDDMVRRRTRLRRPVPVQRVVRRLPEAVD